MAEHAKFEQYEFGSSWSQSEMNSRSSHALVHDGRVWLIDPVDSGDDVERAIGGNEPAGVIQLLDRHNRACTDLAERLGVPYLRLPADIPDSPFTAFKVIDRPKWREVGLWWPEQKALVVAEAVSSIPEIAIGDTGIAVHPFLRLTPPGALRKFTEVDHLLCGHGAPLHGADLGARLQSALDHSRSDIPRTLTRIPAMIKAARA